MFNFKRVNKAFPHHQTNVARIGSSVTLADWVKRHAFLFICRNINFKRVNKTIPHRQTSEARTALRRNGKNG